MKLLLVEDHMDTAQIYSRHLTLAGYEVLHTASGLEALRWARAQTFDVILIDLNLPDIDGSQVGLVLRDKLPNTPFIAMTSEDSRVTRKKTRFFGFDAFITKPTTIALLLETVNTVVVSKNKQ